MNTCNQPKSRGRILLQSSSIRHQPHIDPNYLQSTDDIACMIRAIRLALELIETKPFRRVNATVQWPEFKECSNFGPAKGKRIVQNDRYLECLIRVGGVTAHHPGGSCSIGNRKSSVLDGQFKVRGVRKLRVVDASVLPSPVSGTPHASIVSVAEIAARKILNDF